MLLQDRAAAAADPPLAEEHVLVRERHAVQRPDPAATRQCRVGGIGGGERPGFVHCDESVDRRLHRVSPRERRFGRFARRDTPRADRFGELD